VDLLRRRSTTSGGARRPRREVTADPQGKVALARWIPDGEIKAVIGGRVTAEPAQSCAGASQPGSCVQTVVYAAAFDNAV